MVTIDKVEQGFSKFVDTDFIPSLNRSEVQGAIIAFGLGLAIRRFRAISEHYISNPAVQMLGVVDKSGNIDIDLLRDELKKAIPEGGTRVEIPYIHKQIVLTKDDIDKLYAYTVE